MNKKPHLFVGTMLLIFAGIVPLSVVAQDGGLVAAADKVAAKTGDAVAYDPRLGRNILPAAKLPAAASKKPGTSTYNWTGFYIGGNLGYVWGRGDTQFDPLPSATQFINLAPTNLKPDPKGWAGGFQGGYNWQAGHFVAGGETSFSWSDAKGTKTQTPIIQNNGTPYPGAGFLTTTEDTKWFGTLRGRAGAAFDRVFLYGTAGLAYGDVNYAANSDFRPNGTENYRASFSKTKLGWTAGFGAEVGISQHWSWKAEYLYYDLRKESITIDPAIPLPPFQVRYTWLTKANTFNTGINFRF